MEFRVRVCARATCVPGAQAAAGHTLFMRVGCATHTSEQGAQQIRGTHVLYMLGVHV